MAQKSVAAGAAHVNQFTPLTTDIYTQSSNLTVKSSQVFFSDQFSDKANAIDGNKTNTTNYTYLVGGSAWLSVKDNEATSGEVYPAGTYAGFVFGDAPVVNATNTITIETYLNNSVTPQETYTVPSGLLSVSVLGSGAAQKAGFITTKTFDEIRINYSALVALGTFKVYYAEVLVAGSLGTPTCNTMSSLVQNTYPATVTTATSGLVSADLFGGAVFSNLDNLVDNDISSNKATLKPPIVAAIGAGASVGVRLAGTADLTAGYFAGFEIENNTFLNVNALSGITVSLYAHHPTTGAETLVTSGTGTGTLVSAQLLGSNKQIVGVVATGAFDEVRITMSQAIASVNFGTTDIYRAVIQNNCNKVLECNKSYILKVSDFGAVINAARTGVTGLVSASLNDGVAHPWNLVDANTGNFATIKSTAAVGIESGISVRTPANTYPAGTIAGFTIKDNSSLIGVELFKSIKISTFLNGNPQESASAGALLDLNLLWSGAGMRNIGFLTTMPFDEVRISTGGLADAVATNLDVYNAYIDTRFVPAGTPGFSCVKVKLNPDINAGYINKPIPGKVQTNDVTLPGTTYGTPTVVIGASGVPNPSGATISMNPDGTYSFTATQPGVYNYNVPIIKDGISTGETTLLTITVQDDNPNTLENPIANTDVATTKVGIAVTVDVKENDKSVNPGNTLGNPTVTTQPAHGTTSVVNGKIVYTPDLGFVGTDEFIYEICETPSGKCAKAKVFVTVEPSGTNVPNTTDAAEDYANTKAGTAVSGNVKANDTDPEGDAQTVTPKTNEEVKDKDDNIIGHITLNNSGDYTFTPVSNYSGTAEIVYETMDSKGAKAHATLYLTVENVAVDLSISLTLSPSQIIGAVENTSMEVTVFNQTNTIANKDIKVLIPVNSRISNFSFITGLTTYNGSTVENTKWDYLGVVNGFYTFKKKTLLEASSDLDISFTKFIVTFTYTPPTGAGGTSTLTSYLYYGDDGEDKNVTNNSDAEFFNYRN